MVRRTAVSLRHYAEIERVRRAVMEASGVTDRDERRTACEGISLTPPLGTYLYKVRHDAKSVTDEDIERLRAAGYSEDAILELTLAVSADEAGRRYDAAVRAMRGD